jgi:uncharacterized BrkB/YihY/UPF0761 family membrane protein
VAASEEKIHAISEVGGLLRDTGRAWMEDKVPRLAAALAFYTILSAAPLLVLVLAIAGLVFHQDEQVRKLMLDQFRSLIGERGRLRSHAPRQPLWGGCLPA